ncbi:MAG: hypothetical protein IH969_07220 [Candidatus Krumholzibacteriota bacterium]|nr:hypothetical protein [Candidatus Krumholzibacteriota bacterium]
MSKSEMNEAAGAGAGRFSHHVFTEKDDKTMIGRTNRTIMKASLCAGVAAALLLAPQLSPAQEKEHPEHPEDQAASEMTLDALAVAITDYVKQDAKLKGGFFLVYDAVDKKPLQLTLVKVHKDKLATLGDGVYFACTDMKTADGTVYDLDFMMKETDHGIRTTEVMVHKKSGEPRYAWKEKDGVWTRDKS